MSAVLLLTIGAIASLVGRIGSKMLWYFIKPKLKRKNTEGEKYGW